MTLSFNFYILEDWIIPDPCYYHGRSNWFFDLFYDKPAFNGGHPWPSKFNYILTFIVGVLIGYKSWNLLFERKTIIVEENNEG